MIVVNQRLQMLRNIKSEAVFTSLYPNCVGSAPGRDLCTSVGVC